MLRCAAAGGRQWGQSQVRQRPVRSQCSCLFDQPDSVSAMSVLQFCLSVPLAAWLHASAAASWWRAWGCTHPKQCMLLQDADGDEAKETLTAFCGQDFALQNAESPAAGSKAVPHGSGKTAEC